MSTDAGTGNNWCREHAEDLVMYLYDELTPHGREAVEAHVGSCAACREEIASNRRALGTIDEAHLKRMATFGLPAWSDVEDEFAATLPPMPLPVRRHALPVFAKAASIVLLAGAAFVAGRQWDSIGSIVSNAPETQIAARTAPATETEMAPLPSSATAGDRMRAFSDRTHNYFQRSMLVLLEFANADHIGDMGMRAASRTLLRESEGARRVAGQIHDERIQDLVAELEDILTRIASNNLTADERSALREEVDDLIARLELSAPSHRVAQGRTRT